MATKSFLKNVNIKGRSQTRKFLDALEYAEQHRGKEVVMSRPVTELRGEKAIEFLQKFSEG